MLITARGEIFEGLQHTASMGLCCVITQHVPGAHGGFVGFEHAFLWPTLLRCFLENPCFVSCFQCKRIGRDLTSPEQTGPVIRCLSCQKCAPAFLLETR